MRTISNHLLRLLATLCLIVTLTFNAACGASQLAILRSGLNAAPTLTTSLVTSGVITQAQADGAVKDFTDGADVAVQLGQSLNAIPKDAPNRKQLQFDAVHTAFNKWRTIVARGHFKAHERIEKAALIADGIFVFLDAYYGDKAGNNPHTDVAVDGLSDDEFEQALDQKLKDLKAAMKP